MPNQPVAQPGRSPVPPKQPTEPDAPEIIARRHHAKHLRWSTRQIVLMAVCAAVFVVSAGMLIRYGMDWLHTTQVSEEMRDLYHAQETDAAEVTAVPVLAAAATDAAELRGADASADTASTQYELLSDGSSEDAGSSNLRTTPAPYASTGNPAGKFSQLQKKNGEILGWLTIEGVVDEPVVKRDNTYYLTHNYLGQRSDTGALFMDERVTLYPVPENIVIHGHNMKTGAMFGSLKKYKVKGAAFLKEAGLVQFDTVMEQATYAVFAVVVADIRPTQRSFVNFIGQLSFATDDAYDRYIEHVRGLSIVNVPMDVAPSDRLLTLSTCAGDNENERLLIFCRKVRADESDLDFNYIFNHATDK